MLRIIHRIYNETNLNNFSILKKEYGIVVAIKSVLFKSLYFISDGRVNLYNTFVRKFLVKNGYTPNDLNTVENRKIGQNSIPIVHVWCFWWQGIDTAPDIVRACVNSQKQCFENDPSFLFHILDSRSFNHYCEFDDCILQKVDDGKISLTHFSDLIRMRVLKKYGGVWMDATLLVTGNIAHDLKNCSFYTNKKFTYPEYLRKMISRGRWTSYFIAGSAHNCLFEYMDTAFMRYWEENNCMIDYYLIDFLIDLAYDYLPAVRKMIDDIPCNNEEIFQLVGLLNTEYNETEFEKLCDKNKVHKLSYKFQYRFETEKGLPTYYKKVIDLYCR